MTPTVSCVIPTHGRASFLAEALGSLLAQTRAVDEIVVVTDVHDADTEAVVAEVAARTLVPLRLLGPAASTGASSSRNRGAATARGSHLLFLDDDDVLAPSYVEEVCALFALEPGCDAVLCDIREFREGAPDVPHPVRPDLDVRLTFETWTDLTGSNLVLRRSVFEQMQGFDEELPVQNDADFAVRFLSAGYSFRVLHRPLVGVRRHDSGQLTDWSLRRAEGMSTFYRKHRGRMGALTRRRFRFRIHRMRFEGAGSMRERTVSVVHMVLLADPSHVRAAFGRLARGAGRSATR